MTTTVGNRIKETTSTSGTGPLTLLGAQSGFQTFADVVGVGDYTYYCIIDSLDWEIGIGQLTNSTTLARITVLESTNGDALLSLSASQKTVFCDVPASRMLNLDKDGVLANPTGFRKAMVLDTLADLQGQTGVADGESVFILKATTDDDGLGAMYEYRSSSVDNLNSPDVIDAVGMGSGRWHKVDFKSNIQRFIPQSAEPTRLTPAAGFLAYSDGTASTNGFGTKGPGLYQFIGTEWKLIGSEVKTGANNPVGSVTPDNVGQLYHRTSNNTIWISVGVANTDWVIVSNEEWLAAVNANSQKVYDLGRIDFVALSAEPGDATEGMVAYSDGTQSTNGFGDDPDASSQSERKGLYWFNGSAWSKVGSGGGGASAVGDLADVAANTVLANIADSTGAPSAVTYAALLADMGMTKDTSGGVLGYDASLNSLKGVTVPAGIAEIVGLDTSQTLTNKEFSGGTLSQPVIRLKTSTNPTPTTDGEIWWDSDNNRLVVGDGASQVVISGDVALSGGITLDSLMGTDAIDTSSWFLDGVVTAAKLAGDIGLSKISDITGNRILGNVTGGGAPNELTASDVITMLALDAETDISNLTAWSVASYGSEILAADIEDNPVFGGTAGIVVPSGTTAQRVATAGRIRYNSDNAAFEGYEDGSWKEFVQAGATTGSLDWNSVIEILPAAYDYANDSIIILDASANEVKKTPVSKMAMQIKNKTSNHTLDITDGNAFIEMDSAGDLTVTIPTDAAVDFPIGTTIHIQQKNTGAVDVEAGTPGTTTLHQSAGNICYERYSVMAITKNAANEWTVYGDVK